MKKVIGRIIEILNILYDMQEIFTTDFLSDIATIEAVLIGISIPITLHVVTWVADKYEDQEIVKFFIKEFLYQIQYPLFLINIVLAILLRFLNIKNCFILWFIFLWFVINTIVFYKFIKLVEKYVVNTDKVILAKIKNYVQDFLKK